MAQPATARRARMDAAAWTRRSVLGGLGGYAAELMVGVA
jgi:hypothetical protein